MNIGDHVWCRSEVEYGWIEEGPAYSGCARILFWLVRFATGDAFFVPEAHLEPAECPIRLRVRPMLRVIDGGLA